MGFIERLQPGMNDLEIGSLPPEEIGLSKAV